MSGPINPTHSAPSITTTSAAVLAANLNRKYALIVNDGTADVYLRFGATSVANTGIRLNNGGGNYEMSEALGNLYLGAINGITAAGTSIVTVLEGV